MPGERLGGRDRVLDAPDGDERHRADDRRRRGPRQPVARGGREHRAHRESGTDPGEQYTDERLCLAAGKPLQRQRARHRRADAQRRDVGEQRHPAYAAGHDQHSGEHGAERAKGLRGHAHGRYGANVGVT
jgi:hypothetical protein